jgi:two-component system, OmpR family, sensor histidine kinase SenX3
VAIWTSSADASAIAADNAQLRAHLEALREDFSLLAVSYDRLRAAIESSGNAVVVWDENGNQVLTTLDQLTDGDPAADLVVHRAMLSAGPANDHRVELIGPPHRSIDVSARPILGRDGLIGTIATASDVTRIAQVESLRRDLVMNVSHELRTPVGALSLLAETLVAEVDDTNPDGAVVSRMAHRIESESIRLVRLVNDLLSLASVSESASESISFTPLSISSVVSAAVSRISSAADLVSVPIRIVDEARPGTQVNGDHGHLVSALYNLLDNAVKYSDPGSNVRIRVRLEAPSHVAVDVIDSGIGIAMRDRERIFERFYRVDKARARDTGGTGLGLAIVRNVAVAHGGHVSVKSIEGGGSTFTLMLPRAASADTSEVNDV